MAKPDSKTPEGLKAIPGRKWVRAHYAPQDEDVVQILDEEVWLPIMYFDEGEVPGSVWGSAEKTFQVKQFEPLKISMGVSLPCRKEEARSALQEANLLVQAEFVPALSKVLAMMKQKGLMR